jgi:hypothetical protein
MAIPPPPAIPQVGAKGGTKVKTYIWMPDAKGNLVKMEAGLAKKSFANLPLEAQVQLSQFITGIYNAQSTPSARQNLWNDVVDAAVAKFKDGKKETPWDVLDFMIKNTPSTTNSSAYLTEYDSISADGLLNKIAKDNGFDASLLTPEDRADFLTKLNAEAKTSGKTVTRKNSAGGVETVTTPSTFDAKAFTQSYLWAKVNVGDPKTMPSTAINQMANVKALVKNYGIMNLSSKEINQYSVDVASGNKSIDEVALELSTKAQKLYPIYAERLAANPKLTMKDIAEPVISTLSKVWEKDPTSFDLSDPTVMQFLIPDVTGKAPEVSIAAVYNYAMNHPNREKTKAANDDAKGIGIARAMGFGV